MLTDVYVNRTLNMKRITHIGLDMDHTLVRYKSKNFEALAHKVMRDKLIEKKSYPKVINDLKFQWERSIRGLIIDGAKGNILKLSRHTAIRQSFHGLNPIAYSDRNKAYKSAYIDIKDKSFDRVDTSFSISFAHLYAQLVDLKDNHPHLNLPSYFDLAKDLNEVLDSAHRDGSLKDEVGRNLETYILKDKAIVHGLLKYKKHGKKIFVLTNSEYSYTKLLLDYAITPFMPKGQNWEDLFEFVISQAGKPSFFFKNAAFQSIDTATGEVRNLRGKFTSGVYQGGNAHKLTEDLGLNPDQILYIGDHIYGDIVRLKKDCAWRTALVVEELVDEVKALKKVAKMDESIDALMKKKLPIERRIDKLISDRIEKGVDGTSKPIEDLIKKSQQIDKKLSPMIRKREKMFNPYWGEVMRVGIEESYFAYQVERFACVYMAKLSDLLSLSPRTYFRSAKRPLAHELLQKSVLT